MGIVKREELIAWADGWKIFCADCSDSGEPLTEEDFEEDDIVICDFCKERIL